MGKPRVGRRPDQRSWLEDVPRRVLLTRSAFAAYPDLEFQRQVLLRGANYIFSVTVPVEGYDSRRVVVRFDSRYPNHPVVVVDGSEDSPHRFSSGGGRRRRLCLWFPGDSPDRKWAPGQGLLALLGMVIIHLFKEAWYAENGTWIGEEYPHSEDENKQPPESA